MDALCPVCGSILVHEIDVFDDIGNGISAKVRVLNTWELREFVSVKIAEIMKMLPLPVKTVEAYLDRIGLGNIAERVIDEIKLLGAYEKDGYLLPV